MEHEEAKELVKLHDQLEHRDYTLASMASRLERCRQFFGEFLEHINHFDVDDLRKEILEEQAKAQNEHLRECWAEQKRWEQK
jgi:hypothetical protein